MVIKTYSSPECIRRYACGNLKYTELSLKSFLLKFSKFMIYVDITSDPFQAPLPVLFQLFGMLGRLLGLLVVQLLLALFGPDRVLLDLSLP